MRIDSILARVQSQGGHTIAVQRDAAIIPQAPEAHIPARAARISAVVSPRPSLYAQHPDDPFLAAILRISRVYAGSCQGGSVHGKFTTGSLHGSNRCKLLMHTTALRTAFRCMRALVGEPTMHGLRDPSEIPINIQKSSTPVR
jgi:hypothetical protein